MDFQKRNPVPFTRFFSEPNEFHPQFVGLPGDGRHVSLKDVMATW